MHTPRICTCTWFHTIPAYYTISTHHNGTVRLTLYTVGYMYPVVSCPAPDRCDTGQPSTAAPDTLERWATGHALSVEGTALLSRCTTSLLVNDGVELFFFFEKNEIGHVPLSEDS
jgi:hypothetical protein